jgi:EmrB/QacA subfamily drug resistance transporter
VEQTLDIKGATIAPELERPHTRWLRGSGEGDPPANGPDPRRWLILGILVLAQLMVVLDATIVNIALPQAQTALDISDANRQWVVTAYALAFGGLLLLGGRIADYTGRRRTFVVGALGFAAASALGGLATSQYMLFGSRALQGVFAALLAPAALSLITTTFPRGKDRTRAFAAYGAVSGGGAAVGLLLGGVLVEYLSWRWTLLVNVPIALLAGLMALRYVPESKAGGKTRYDIPGAVTVTAGLVSLVYGFTKAESSWTSATTLTFLAVGVVLLVAFVVIELRSSHPLLPLRIPLNRNRGGAFIAALCSGAAIGGAFLFLVYYFQVVAGYSAIQSGLASLPISVGVVAAASMAGAIVQRMGPRVVISGGALLAAGGLAWLSQLTVSSSYVGHVMPAILLFGLGLGMVFVPLANLATLGVDARDAGAASALTNASQQVGASLGTALLNTFYATAVVGYLTDNAGQPGAQSEALTHGYSVAFMWGAGIMVLCAILVATLTRARKEDLPVGETLPAMH